MQPAQTLMCAPMQQNYQQQGYQQQSLPTQPIFGGGAQFQQMSHQIGPANGVSPLQLSVAANAGGMLSLQQGVPATLVVPSPTANNHSPSVLNGGGSISSASLVSSNESASQMLSLWGGAVAKATSPVGRVLSQ